MEEDCQGQYFHSITLANFSMHTQTIINIRFDIKASKVGFYVMQDQPAIQYE